MNYWVNLILRVAVICSVVSIVLLKKFYSLKKNHRMVLKDAPGMAVITREEETDIAHIQGENLHAALYAQGWAHAETRLWKMETIRRVYQGTTAEIFGDAALPIDRIVRTLGLHRTCKETYEQLPAEDKEILQAYADGVNSFIRNVKFGSAAPAWLLPPEIYLFGL